MILPPLLLTKFSVPAPGQGLVLRPRLFQRLDQSLAPGHRLTLLSAQAGYGKTTLVSSWIRRHKPVLQAAWLALDEADNDLIRFWSTLVAALQSGDSSFGKDLLPLLQSLGQAGDETFRVLLLNELAKPAFERLLILDDYHFIQNPAIHKGMEYLIERLPDECHVLILSRSDPPFSFSLLRGRGKLLEIGQEDLCFKDDEAASFLVDGLGLNLSGQDVCQLNSKTEGWASGLQMAAASLRGRKDPTKFIRSFSGTNRFIFDYLSAEVLERQPPHILEFLLKTCILEVLTAPLCEAVCQVQLRSQGGVPGSETLPAQQVLEELERSNLFLVSLDEEHTAFRYHPLFAGLLRSRLQQIDPDQAALLYSRAGGWLVQQGLTEQAIRYAILAQDYDQAARLLSKKAELLWSRGEHATLLRLLSSLPDSILDDHPDLRIYQAGCWVSGGSYPEAEACLDRAGQQVSARAVDQAEANRLQGRAAAVRAMVAAFRGDAQGTRDNARLAAERLPETDSAWILSPAYMAGSTLMIAGQLEEARQEFVRAMDGGRKFGSPLIYLMAASQLFRLDWSQGKIGKSRETIREALAYLQANRLEDTPLAGDIQVGQAFLRMEQGFLEEAEAIVRRCLQLSLPGGHYPTIANLYLVLMSCQSARRDWQGAEGTYREVERILQDHEVPHWTACGIAGAIASVWANQNHLEKAERFLLERGVVPGEQIAFPHQAEYVSLAYLLVRQGRFEPAAEVLQRLAAYVRATEQWAGMVPILYIQAELFQKQGLVDRATRTLDEAMDLAHTYGQIQAYFLIGDELLPLMKKVARRRRAPEAVRRLVAQPEKPGAEIPAETSIEKLSGRELEVLRLVGEGLTNKEIALRLHLALQTVKYHTSNLYGKLGVENRSQAILKAQALGLLSSE